MMHLLPLAPERASRLVSAFSNAHVLVIGDAMLDTFLVGRVTRISPEAPVPVVAFHHQTHRIGGAANVAQNITALGGHVTLIGVIGQDDNGAALTRGCREAGIEAGFLATDSDRVTTTKVRIVTERNQQVARVDYESDAEISGHALLQDGDLHGGDAEQGQQQQEDQADEQHRTARVARVVLHRSKSLPDPCHVDRPHYELKMRLRSATAVS